MAEMTVIRWRDIPMQIVVRGDGDAAARRLLADRFQEAVDAAAMVAGLIGSDDYTEQMVMDRREVGDDLEAQADAEVARIATLRTSSVHAARTASSAAVASASRSSPTWLRSICICSV